MAASVDINRIENKNKPYLQFDFKGKLTEEISRQAVADWKAKMPSDNSKINLIYNCAAMTGFETGARRNWQTTMKELKNRIGEVWIVSDNVFLLSAAHTMGIVTGFKIKSARSLEQVS